MPLSITFHHLWASVQDEGELETLAYVVQLRTLFAYIRALSNIRLGRASPSYLNRCVSLMEMEMVNQPLTVLSCLAHTFSGFGSRSIRAGQNKRNHH